MPSKRSPRPTPLEISLLGRPEFRAGGVRLGLLPRKAVALLAYLAVEGRAQSREHLAELLWPAGNRASSRAALRNLLAQLNKALGAAGLEPLRSDTDWIALAPEQPLWLDLSELEAVLRLPEGHAALLERLEAVIPLWRGEFLEGLGFADAPDFEDWVALRREALRQQMTQVLERLAAAQAEAGQLHKALESTARRIQLEPLDEAAHRQLITLYLRAGNRGKALEAYQSLCDLLRREVGVEPALETELLVRPLLRPSRPEPGPGPLGDVRARTRMLVGREGELEALETAWNAGKLIFITGEPGVGKSRLASEFAAGMGTFACAEAFPTDADIPYATLARLLRRLLERHPGSLLPLWVRRELSRILPELEAEPLALERIEGEEGKLRFLEACAELMRRAGPGLGTLILDDLHNADLASFEAAIYGLNRVLEGGLRAVFIYRRGELKPAVEAQVRALLEREAAVRLDLHPLPPDGVRRLLLALGRADLEPLAEAFSRFTGGNPLFVLETVRAIDEAGGLTAHGEARLPRSPTVTTIIERRLERLPHTARELARLVAVADEVFSHELAAAALRLDPLELSAGLEALAEARVLQGLRFSHDLWRETVKHGISPGVAQFLHLRVLEFLEASPGPVSPALKARHAEGAGKGLEAGRYWLQAGDQAVKAYAYADGVAHLERARALWQASGQASARDWAELELLLGRLAHYQGDAIGAQAAFERALEWARAGRAPGLECRALNHLGHLLSWAGPNLRPAQAEEHHLEAQRIAQQHGLLAELAQTEYYLAVLNQMGRKGQDPSHHRQRLRRAIEHARRAVELSRAAGLSEIQPWAWVTLASAHFYLGQWASAEAALGEAQQRFTRTENARGEAEGWVLKARLHVQSGEPHKSLEAARKAHALAARAGSYEQELGAALALGFALLTAGHYAEGLEVAQSAYRLGMRARPPRRMGSLILLGLAHQNLGDWGTAEALLEEARAVGLHWDQLGEFPFTRLCDLRLWQGRWEEAADLAQAALERREYGRFSVFAGLRWNETKALLLGGAREQAERDVEQLEARFAGHPRYALLALASRGVLLGCQGQFDAGLERLRQAARTAAAMGLPLEHWLLEAEQAHWLSHLGRPEEAQACLERARGVLAGLTQGLPPSRCPAFWSAAEQVLEGRWQPLAPLAGAAPVLPLTESPAGS